ncbi:hypothetical protein KIH31_13245 [Paenarthrobacter sp. DKR-5]|uniref:hypothetical protein n=1 Tax=Paenarthrobacter sp. DKR-5 TaxID=2835535 RepID=UPI001BDBE884|nr:hypothetical protein [Paenarthrobacter sp. DKR-5]MBT1003570.1 hypothetical protein [Paenarthrobacter sp. DKR-5]
MRRLSPLAWFTLVAAVVGVLFAAAFLFLPYDDAWGLGMLMALGAVFLAALVATVHARRHVLLLLAGVAATAFVACGLAFLQLWGLAFAPMEASLTSAVDSHKSNLYFYIAAGSFVAMMGLLFLGAFWPQGRRPVSRPAPRATAQRTAARPAPRTAARPAAPRTAAQRQPAPRTSAPRQTTPRPAPRSGAPRQVSGTRQGVSGTRPVDPQGRSPRR